MAKINVREHGVHCRDAALATIEVVPFSPRFPCPTCGKESKLHISADPGKAMRICTGGVRHVWDATGVKPQPSAPHRFPCQHCRCETKVDGENREQRICPNCGQIYRDDLIPS